MFLFYYLHSDYFGHCLLAFMCFAEGQIVPFILITGANGSHSTEIVQEYQFLFSIAHLIQYPSGLKHWFV